MGNVNGSIGLSKRSDREENLVNTPCALTLCNPSCSQIGTYWYTSKYELRTYTGWNIPDFKKRQSRGDLLPHTPWTQTLVSGSASGGRVQTGTAGWTLTWDGWYPYNEWASTPTVDMSSVPSASDMAQMAAANCYEQGFDVLTFLAELTDVKRTFLETGRMLLKIKDIPRSLRKLSASWLSWRYGWRTLFYDLKSLDQAVTKLRKKAERQRNSGVAKTVTTGSSTDHYVDVLSNVSIDVVVKDEWEIVAKGSVTADISIGALQFNPVATAWEIIPFSFVIDWFVGVGKAISAASFLALASSYAASGGYRVTNKRTLNASLASIDASNIASDTAYQTAECQYEKTVRSPCNVPYTPQFNLRLNVAKVTDLVALVVQRWK